MRNSPESLKHNLIAAGVLDRPRLHHQFKDGQHGKKLDLGPDKILPGSPEYQEMVEAMSREIRYKSVSKYLGLVTLVGVSEGADVLAQNIADNVGLGLRALPTNLDQHNRLAPDLESMKEANIQLFHPELEVIGVDYSDATGRNMLQAADHLRHLGVTNIQALYVWLRNPELARLNNMDIPYDAVIKDSPLPTYLDYANCEYCQAGEVLIPY